MDTTLVGSHLYKRFVCIHLSESHDGVVKKHAHHAFVARVKDFGTNDVQMRQTVILAHMEKTDGDPFEQHCPF